MRHRKQPDRNMLLAHYTYNPATGLFHHKRNNARAKRGSVAGCIRSDGYVIMSVGNIDYLAHQLAWLYVYDEWVPEIDHKNRTPGDNWIENLRPATHGQNCANSTGGPKRGRKYQLPRGVYPVTRSKKPRFLAQITDQKRQIYLGIFKTIEEADWAYKEASKMLFGDFAPS